MDQEKAAPADESAKPGDLRVIKLASSGTTISHRILQQAYMEADGSICWRNVPVVEVYWDEYQEARKGR